MTTELSEADICVKLKRLMVRELELPLDPTEIADDVKLFAGAGDSLALDSIEALTISLFIEEEFGVAIPEDMEDEERLTVFDSVRSLGAYIADRRRKQGAA